MHTRQPTFTIKKEYAIDGKFMGYGLYRPLGF